MVLWRNVVFFLDVNLRQLLFCFLAYLSPPLINSPTLRSCNLLGRSSRSKCSIRSGSSWPRLPTALLLNCFVRRLEILVKLKSKQSNGTNHCQTWPVFLFQHTAGFQLVSAEELCSLALNREKKNKWSISYWKEQLYRKWMLIFSLSISP